MAPTYASTSVVNDIALLPLTVASSVVAVDLKTGLPLWVGPILGPPSSTAVVSGSSIYLGTGTNETDLEYKALGLAVPADSAARDRPVAPLPAIRSSGLPASGRIEPARRGRSFAGRHWGNQLASHGRRRQSC